jgi:YidC/Oxa1 family membrane protein insertase
MGPQDYDVLQDLGADMEDVNPYGWRFFRPIVRPFVGVILLFLNWMHDTLSIGYGWVLIIFGVLMRVVLWPLNQKAMRAQLRNMAVQPLVKEVQTRYKDQPEKLQAEMMKLYKEHGFNPLGGCLPMLLPWPVLIALFFVFQNTIELRGVEFLWLPDLSAKDPFYILPLFLAVSMFLLQFISLRSMPEANPQLKFMMWFMPLFFGFIFLQFPSGLNLYYATANIATIPQQILIARERKKVKPVTLGGSGDGSSGGSGGSSGSGGSASGGSGGSRRKKSRRERKK